MLGKLVRGISSLIVVLSALNVGIRGISHHQVNVMARLGLEGPSLLGRIVSIIIGLAGVICLLGFFGCCRKKSCHSHCHGESSKSCCHHHSDKE
ncbi:DUF378 domain-containing protein [Chlamydia pecorum]|uniref:Uncharacterized protein n=2 Tax=Chlamydia pecorum TaxID=85991 RepID=A0AA34RD62_CHLPE|nr:DUF378 domain-containing protein [Chlamydia pecorum]AEB41587.1 conserved hypothetical protein [Chlamydia pecorum E58]AGW37787.1 hypothetical protein CPE1_0288 [Chlamydia pecorum PV3056/3]ETF37861.1 hypothetical protein CpecF_0545 [Chlamydia pecorum DBDeUG]ETF38128.1 hypothetical protein CpecG_0543 [Chlamydia pecorum MC/MarsBar]ETF40097.1 hypothetical protein CpecA_0544 [Chlamydia pecorum IPTaLE]